MKFVFDCTQFGVDDNQQLAVGNVMVTLHAESMQLAKNKAIMTAKRYFGKQFNFTNFRITLMPQGATQ